MTEETKGKIKKIAKELGYRTNNIAKSLVTGKTNTIGFITDNVASTPFAGEIIHGAQEKAFEKGMLLTIINVEDNKDLEKKAMKLMQDNQVTGIIYSTWYHRKINLQADISNNIPIVLVNCSDENNKLPAVVPDEMQGGYDATTALLNAGHKEIAFINTTSKSPAQQYRLEGYCNALKDHNIQFNRDLVFYATPNQDGGYAVADEILRMKVTSVFCHNDRVAMGLYDKLKEKGIKIPEDISIIGFDNQDIISNHLHPKLSTVGLPHYLLGKKGVELITKLVVEKDLKDTLIKVNCPTIIRDSIKNIKY
jgi:LacI family transcriptional regulator